MRFCLVLVTFVFAGAASAQEVELIPPTLDRLAAGAEGTSAEPVYAELGRSLDFVYAEVEALRREQEPSVASIVAVGAGAGAGFVLGTLTGGVILVPAVAGAATTAGMTSGWINALSAGVNTVTSVAFTLWGSAVGDALVK